MMVIGMQCTDKKKRLFDIVDCFLISIEIHREENSSKSINFIMVSHSIFVYCLPYRHFVSHAYSYTDCEMYII